MPETEVATTLVEIKSALGALDAKLESRADLIAAKIDAGDRESIQLFKLQEQSLSHLKTTIGEHDSRIANIATIGQTEREKHEKEHTAAQDRHDAVHERLMTRLETTETKLDLRIEALETWRSYSKGIIALLALVWPIVIALILNYLK